MKLASLSSQFSHQGNWKAVLSVLRADNPSI